MSATLSYKCICCNREYQRKLFYDKHILLCHLMMTKSIADMKKDNEEQAGTPTVRVLYEIILEMNAKMVKMEARLDEYAKWVESKKRKLNIVDWLNETYKSYPTSYTSWFNAIKLSRHHLEMMFDMDYVLGVAAILQTLMSVNSDSIPIESSIPIKCFDQKDNVLFIFNNDKWQVMPAELFDTLMMTLSKKLITEFIAWQNEHYEQLENGNDNFAATHAQNLRKVMGGNISIELLGLRVKKEVFKYLKVNLKNVIQ